MLLAQLLAVPDEGHGALLQRGLRARIIMIIIIMFTFIITIIIIITISMFIIIIVIIIIIIIVIIIITIVIIITTIINIMWPARAASRRPCPSVVSLKC